MESRFSTPQQMRESVFIDGPEARARLSRFWLLLVLSAIIAAAGVVADSTAAVIGAMIVAPLLGPIQGTMLATVLGDRANLVRSLLLVVAGRSSPSPSASRSGCSSPVMSSPRPTRRSPGGSARA